MKNSTTTRFSAYTSPLGPMTLATRGNGLAGIWFDGQKYGPDASHWTHAPKDVLLEQAARELTEYFHGTRQHFDLPLDLDSGTAFQQRVWKSLLAIAPGETVSYGELSQRLSQPTAVRAVAAAIGKNPISIVVPCHRVVGSNGALTGYAGGLERKAALLQLESNH
jgi:methylated-DNA-[protein]-cysteine S-methyltransferase